MILLTLAAPVSYRFTPWSFDYEQETIASKWEYVCGEHLENPRWFIDAVCDRVCVCMCSIEKKWWKYETWWSSVQFVMQLNNGMEEISTNTSNLYRDKQWVIYQMVRIDACVYVSVFMNVQVIIDSSRSVFHRTSNTTYYVMRQSCVQRKPQKLNTSCNHKTRSLA